ncbi:trypsin-3-like [Tetranychus urticae]|uniref:Peptidase S1 domain-containing protein n=1 Tax=Tetranychus urticae TaxID=32264 RepID=T1K0Z0_TETUR|nr:trypsin-3-like [Tetranychus urticae]
MIGLKFKRLNRLYFKVKWLSNWSSVLLISLLVVLDNVHGFNFQDDTESTSIPIFDSDTNSNGLLVGGSFEYYEDNGNATEKSDQDDYIDSSGLSGPGGILEDYVPAGNDEIPQMINRVIGGIPADEDTFPYIVSLRYNYAHHCGASILSPTWILTAAHCVKKETPHLYRVQANYNNLRDQRQKFYEVRKIIVPSRRGDYADDIALVKLAEPLPLGDKITTVKLPSYPPKSGQKVTVAGWGAVGKKSTDKLMTADFPLRSKTECGTVFRRQWNSGMICAGIKGVDACPGDSGGPLVIRGPTPRDDVLIGVVSWGPICGTSYGVYADVWHYRRWLESNTDLDDPNNDRKFPWHSYVDNEPNKGRPGRWPNKWRSAEVSSWNDNPISRTISKVLEPLRRSQDKNNDDSDSN